MTLFASGDSATPATLVPAWPRALRLGRPKSDPAVAETALLELVGRYAQHFDVIAAEPDPIYAAIEERKKAMAAFEIGRPHSDDVVDQLSASNVEATRRMFRTAPTTVAGLTALVSYVRDCESSGDDILELCMDDDGLELARQAFPSAVAPLKNYRRLAVGSGGTDARPMRGERCASMRRPSPHRATAMVERRLCLPPKMNPA